MTATLIILAVIMGSVVFWLIRQTLNVQPWAEEGPIGQHHAGGPFSIPAAKIGLITFLAVASSLFSLFVSAYFQRMEYGDWTPLTEPGVLWISTGLLILASIFFQIARNAAIKSQVKKVKSNLLIAGIFTFAFIAGQFWAWQELHDAGYFLTSNPANSFFYVLTAIHALHIFGGLWVWSKTVFKLQNKAEVQKLRMSVELCTIYWHFLLLVWLVLFALLLST
ncbi:MAG: cytochrome c oxidase subunit 3 [Pseudomonadota bacterium]